MSADSLDDSKGLQISGIAVEWERCQALRAHLRGEGAVMFDKDMSESVKHCCTPWIHGYLQPLLLRMAETDQKLQPLVDPLREEISNLYNMFSKQVESSQVVYDSWMTRKFLGFVKMKARKEQPSTDKRFQELVLMLNPLLEDLCREINEKQEEKRRAREAAGQSKDPRDDDDDDHYDSDDLDANGADGSEAAAAPVEQSPEGVAPDQPRSTPGPAASSGPESTPVAAVSSPSSGAGDGNNVLVPETANAKLEQAKKRLEEIRVRKAELERAKSIQPPAPALPPSGGFATDAMDTCPMTNSQVEMAAQHMGSLPSPIPSKSPELTADDRRAQYQNTGPQPNPNSASPASDCPVHGSPGVKSAATSSKDEVTTDFVTRNDQLNFKKARKEQGSQKRKANQKNKGKKSGKKGKRAIKPTKSKSRKRQVLASAGSSQSVARGRKVRKTKDAVAGVDADAADTSAPSTRARAPKAKASAKPDKPGPRRAAKAKASPKQAPKSKRTKPIKKDGKEPAKKPAQKRGRTPRKPGFDLPANPLRDNATVKDLMKFAKQFPEDMEHDIPKLKKAILNAMTPLQWTKLMPYWSRNGCGVKVLEEDESTYIDRHTFTYNASSAPRRYKLAVAVRCAELAAQGIDAELPGYYEKDGDALKQLKVNANLALFFFANEAELDFDLESDAA